MLVSLDFETRSRVDLRNCGAWRYARHPSTRVLCLSWGRPGERVRTWTPWSGEEFPAPLRASAAQGAAGQAVFRAHNAAFERNIWNFVLRRGPFDLPELPPSAFVCTMAEALAAGWPAALDAAARAMGLEVRKDAEGEAVMREVSDGTRRLRVRLLPRLHAYCENDVRVEMEVAARVPPLSAAERKLWLLDQAINDRGVRIDVPAAHAVRRAVHEETCRINAALSDITAGKVTRVTQAARMRDWLAAAGVPLPDLGAETVRKALARPDLPKAAQIVLRARQHAGGAATSKLVRMIEVPDPADLRARGLLQYHGAAATGRWAGRLIQPQNMPRPTLKGVDGDALVSAFVAGRVRERFEDVFSAATDALRPLITADPGKALVRADLREIEARCVLWLAGHADAMAMFRAGRDIYCEMATSLFGRPISREDEHERRVGKLTILQCGYQMGPGKFPEHAAAYGITVTPLQAADYVGAYRRRWFKVPRLWRGLQNAALRAAVQGGTHSFRGVDFAVDRGALCCRIPSGRVLRWQGLRLVDQDTMEAMRVRQGQWESVSLYGGILTERAVSATARDVMAEGMLRAEAKGLPVVLTVHDEVVVEVPEGEAEAAARTLRECMTAAMAWAPDLPLDANTAVSFRYGK